METATIFTLFKANILRCRPLAATTKKVARPKAATFVLAFDKINIVAITTILVLHVGNGPKMNFQGRETGRLGSGVFVIPQTATSIVLWTLEI